MLLCQNAIPCKPRLVSAKEYACLLTPGVGTADHAWAGRRPPPRKVPSCFKRHENVGGWSLMIDRHGGAIRGASKWPSRMTCSAGVIDVLGWPKSAKYHDGIGPDIYRRRSMRKSHRQITVRTTNRTDADCNAHQHRPSRSHPPWPRPGKIGGTERHWRAGCRLFALETVGQQPMPYDRL